MNRAAEEISIRPARSGDAAPIAALVERYWDFEEIPGFDRARMERLIGGLIDDPAQGLCWVAEDARGLVGYIAAVFMLSLEHGGTMAEVDEFFVTAEHRSRGLGRRLLEATERDLEARGVVRLQLQVDVDNHAAQRMYERGGFTPRSRYRLMDKALAAAGESSPPDGMDHRP